jgi:Flp pilus assembly protein TadD
VSPRPAPSFAAAYHHLGFRLKKQGNLDAAVAIYRQALQVDADDPQILANLGAALLAQGRLGEAYDCYARAAELAPDSAAAQTNLGVILAKTGRTQKALDAFRKAVQLEPDLALAHRNLADALREEQQVEEAIACYRCALDLKPDYPQVQNNLAMALCEGGRLEESLAVFRALVESRPGEAELHWNYSLVLLLSGDFEQGWREYEYRWQAPSFRSPRRNFARPLWTGSDLAGRTILLHAEQGLGDTIQFIRYAPILAERAQRVGATVIVECQPELCRLLQGLPGVERVIPAGRALGEFDLHCPMLSLPVAMGTTARNIPNRSQYLHAPEDLRQRWAKKVGEDPAGYRVGLVWAGSPTHANDRRRSIPPDLLSPLASVAGVTFYSIQLNSTSAPAGINFIDHAQDLHDFADTAGLIMNLDLIISVDTAAAHLAGALGRKVWTMLPYSPDWRWQMAREDSPWYPTMRLFRQPRAGDGGAVIDRVVVELRGETILRGGDC